MQLDTPEQLRADVVQTAQAIRQMVTSGKLPQALEANQARLRFLLAAVPGVHRRKISPYTLAASLSIVFTTFPESSCFINPSRFDILSEYKTRCLLVGGFETFHPLFEKKMLTIVF